MKENLGTITKEQDGFRVRFERIFHNNIQKVWDALTKPEILKIWFSDIEMDLRPGGKMTIWFQDEANTASFGEVIKVEAPHVFSFSWEGEVALWQLYKEGETQCRVVFTYSKLADEYAVNGPAGFHSLLDQLETVLAGRKEPYPFGSEEDNPQQRALQELYGQQVYPKYPELLRYKPVVVEQTIKAPADKVWQAITIKDQMRLWYFDLSEFKAESGFEFSFKGKGHKGEEYLHLCRVTEVIPQKKLSYSWSYQGYEGMSYVSFELYPKEENTKVVLVHRGLGSFPDNHDFARSSFEAGWTELITKSLKRFLEG